MQRTLLIVLFFYLQSLTLSATAQGWQWATGSSCKMGYFESAPLAVDNWGNTYEAGQYSFHSSDSFISVFGTHTVVDSAEAGNQAILVSTNAQGKYRWAIGAQFGKVVFYKVQADPFGNVYIIGKSDHYFRFGDKSLSDSTHILVKVDSSGHVAWIKPITPNPFDVNALRINSSGHVYIAGSYRSKTFAMGASVFTNPDTSGFTAEAFFAKLDSSGNILWARTFGGSSHDFVTDMEVTKDSLVYISGMSSSSDVTSNGTTFMTGTTGEKLYVAKFNANGHPLWGRFMKAMPSTYFALSAITSDGYNNVYVTGQYGNDFVFGNDTLPRPFAAGAYGYMFVAKYDSSGGEKWARTIPRGKTFYQGYSIAQEDCLVWVSGAVLTSPMDDDSMFLAAFDTTGHLVNTILLTSGGDDNNAITTDHKGNLYIGGDYYSSSFVVGHDTLTRTDNMQEALFVLKYRYGAACQYSGTETIPAPVAEYKLFPNPATQQCTIHSSIPFAAGAKMELYDLTGRYMGQYALKGSDCVIPLTRFEPGLYECRIYNSGAAVQTLKLMINR